MTVRVWLNILKRPAYICPFSAYVLKLRPVRPIYIRPFLTLTTVSESKGRIQTSSAAEPYKTFTTTMNSSTLESVLARHTFEQYSVEYEGYLFNHICHGIISLYRLGVDEPRIQRFIDWYTPRLEDVETRKNSDQGHVAKTKSGDGNPISKSFARVEDSTLASIAELLGTNSSFYYILEVFEKKLTNAFDGSVKDMLRKCYPGLMRGFAGSAFHGLIHLGYGCAAKNTRLITEGLAYLHYCYLPLTTSQSTFDRLSLTTLGHGHYTVQQVLEQIRDDHELRTYLSVQSNDPALVAREVNSFERPMRVLLSRRGDTLLEYVHRIKFPENLNDPLESDCRESLDRRFKWAIDVALIVYSKVERRNDFFLLHGVTSAFSLREINSFLSAADLSDKSAPSHAPSSTTNQAQGTADGLPKQLDTLNSASSLMCPTQVGLEALRTYLCTLLAAYLVQGAPRLIEDSSHDSLKCSWAELKGKALGRDCDEHVYKLLQICCELDAETESPAVKDVYKSAVNIALEYEFTFHPDE